MSQIDDIRGNDQNNVITALLMVTPSTPKDGDDLPVFGMAGNDDIDGDDWQDVIYGGDGR